MMQQATASTKFPIKLQRITGKVVKILSQKYRLDENAVNNAIQQLRNDRCSPIEGYKFNEDQTQTSFQKTQKLNKKLKLLRTMLGYEYESSQKKLKMENIGHEQQKHLDQKGPNLKQFVMSMRKRNQLTDKYFTLKKANLIEEKSVAFDPESKNLQQYTDASLKYVHSFLPHQTTLQHSNQRSKKSSQYLTLTPQYEKSHSLIDKSSQYIETIENSCTQSVHAESNSSLEKQKYAAFNTKRSLTFSNPNQIFSKGKGSIYQLREIRRQSVSQLSPVLIKQHINLPPMENSINHSDFKMISSTTPMDVRTNRVTELIYKGKNYNRQLKNNILHHKHTQKTMNVLSNQDKKPVVQILPIIKSCIPENRSRLISIPHN